MMQPSMVTTMFELPGYKVEKNLGLVRGITVRSRSVVGNVLGGFRMIFGGTMGGYTKLCERAREQAYELMCQHAEEVGAQAIVAVRYDATELMPGLTEVLCYGTAVTVTKIG
jgi:uncharacterized protein YbjQ (UPF0145 family)